MFFFRDRIILSITELDALWYDREQILIDQDFKNRILADIEQFNYDRSFLKIFKEIGLAILAFMFVVIFPYLPGSDSPIFKGVSVFIGIVFTLGSSSIIGNMIAGLVITYMRPFKLGDQIKIGDIVGNVVEKTPFVTRIRTPKKEFITVPNSNVLLSNVINYSNSKLQGGLIVHTSVTIGYDVPWRRVHQILVNAAKKNQQPES
jgi:small-conductance mechanosensitive channel